MREAYDGLEGCLNLFPGELGPVEAQKPLMLLDFLGSFGEANPVFRFFDEKLVDQIDTLPGEVELAVSDIKRGDLGFVLCDVFAYFVSRSAVEWPLRQPGKPSS